MVELTNNEKLSLLLKAVSNDTRCALLRQLCQQGANRVTDLANHYDMSLNAMSKHIKVLEGAGLVTREMRGRTHWIEADLSQVDQMFAWLDPSMLTHPSCRHLSMPQPDVDNDPRQGALYHRYACRR
ncbi:MAG: winged helix-turn-helix transcriptional regulator [Gammaproteobacteria bacterium]|nr:winged helix-turn-helix transcriptional regulator [Gammaproteobacteria bacterium]MCP4874841.1 winged helix-turn-helix transcriptional regulator [Gammaproteobacteria bacterium]MCP4982086.1 winged helix-turn-helix transcriptional regulator [Gammaproteobacteria bacterium]